MLDFLVNNMWAMWLFIAAAFLVLEAATSALVSIWFVAGAVLVSILSIWVRNIPAQIVIFIVASALFMFLCRRFFNRSRAEKLDDTNAKLIGKTGVVKTDIMGTEGKVLIGDVYWRAVSDTDIAEGESVTVTKVDGNLLTVEKKI